jgi:hypothetical protein
MFNKKKYFHTLGFMQCLGCHYPYWWFSLLFQQFSLLAAIQRVFFVHYLHMVHKKYEWGHWFMNILFIRVPPNNQDISLYLVLTDERCLNSLLSAGLLKSNSSHLFWKRGLESYEYLEACSHE